MFPINRPMFGTAGAAPQVPGQVTGAPLQGTAAGSPIPLSNPVMPPQPTVGVPNPRAAIAQAMSNNFSRPLSPSFRGAPMQMAPRPNFMTPTNV